MSKHVKEKIKFHWEPEKIFQDEYRISPSEIEPATRVLKEGELFLNSSVSGEIFKSGKAGLGLYYKDTRFLSHFELKINNADPVLLSSTSQKNCFSQIELSNKSTVSADGKEIPLQTIHLRILRIVKNNLIQRIRLINFNPFPLWIFLDTFLDADFADIFEVRGVKRKKRGKVHSPKISKKEVTFSYSGLDKTLRKTHINFLPSPYEIKIIAKNKVAVRYLIELPPQKKRYFQLQITPVIEEEKPKCFSLTKIAQNLCRDYNQWNKECTSFESDNDIYNQMLHQALIDLRALLTKTHKGKYLAAGIPWYTCPFGRDSLITAWQTLMVNPEIAKWVLRFLAKYQGKRCDNKTEEAPGKIIHEMRQGEMSKLGEVPYLLYYGSIDSTLLFIILLVDTFLWTKDKEFVLELFEPFQKALKWIDNYGDLDGDGFVEYQRKSLSGLLNQGWKDSSDGIINPRGKFPVSPIALVEIQGYVYQAKLKAGMLFDFLGHKKQAKILKNQAEKLKIKFLEKFWVPHKKYLALALDGEKKHVATIASNAGYSLLTKIVPYKYARYVVNRLFSTDMYSGWGIRTLSSQEKAYNPMSYHNGTIWPHDNSLIARGLKEYGFDNKVETLATSFFEASLHFDYYRLPELFCGFTRRFPAAPVKYPVACSLQAWATGSIFLFLQSMLGIFPQLDKDIFISNPTLPRWLNRLQIKNLRMGKSAINLEFIRKKGKTSFKILKKW